MIIHIVLSVDFAILGGLRFHKMKDTNATLLTALQKLLSWDAELHAHTTAWARVKHYPRMTDRIHTNTHSGADDHNESSGITDHKFENEFFTLRIRSRRQREVVDMDAAVALFSLSLSSYIQFVWWCRCRSHNNEKPPVVEAFSSRSVWPSDCKWIWNEMAEVHFEQGYKWFII